MQDTKATRPGEPAVRYNWLKIMYAYTIIGAGSFGLLYIVSPGTFIALLGLPSEEPMIAGVMASTYVAFAVLSVFGLRSPLKFVPVLMLQLTYKTIWFIAIIMPLLVAGRLPMYAIPLCAIFASYIVGDLIAIPFHYVFKK
jgi:hypothetical protein